jgi:hypothetical protein
LHSFAVFYATPLDLDYSMLLAFKAAYQHLEPGERGPGPSDPTITVLGENGTRPTFWREGNRIELLRWYRYLFLSRSKPSTHLKALSRLSDGELKADAPKILSLLVQHIQEKVSL